MTANKKERNDLHATLDEHEERLAGIKRREIDQSDSIERLIKENNDLNNKLMKTRSEFAEYQNYTRNAVEALNITLETVK